LKETQGLGVVMAENSKSSQKSDNDSPFWGLELPNILRFKHLLKEAGAC